MGKIRRRFKSFGAYIVVIIIAGVLAAGYTALTIWSNALISQQTSQQAALRWGGGNAQITCFLSDDIRYAESSLNNLRYTIEQSLTEASIKPEGGKRLWYDAYSTERTLTLYGPGGKNGVAVNATAVGGDFFKIHELTYLSGYPFSPEDLMQDRIVIDSNAAWQLFGSYDVSGMAVTISGKSFPVAAVALRGDGEVYNTAYGEKPRVYLSYAAMAAMDSDLYISCYEAVLPNPISGFALDIVQKSMNINAPDAEYLDNTARYQFLPLLDTLSAIPVRSMRSSRIMYPYWENIAGVTEDYAAILLLFRLVCAGGAGLIVFVALMRYITTHPLRKDRVVDFMDDKISKFRRRFPKKIKNKSKNKSKGEMDNENDKR